MSGDRGSVGDPCIDVTHSDVRDVPVDNTGGMCSCVCASVLWVTPSL